MGQQSGRANPICSGAICALQGGAARGGLRARFECACQANRRAESDSYSETRRLRPRCAQRRGYGNHSGRQRACMMRTPCPSPRLFLALQSGKSWPMQEHIVVAALVLRHTEGSDRDWSPRPHAAATGDYVLEKSRPLGVQRARFGAPGHFRAEGWIYGNEEASSAGQRYAPARRNLPDGAPRHKSHARIRASAARRGAAPC